MFDLKAFRIANNLTQLDIAKILGCNVSFVSSVENGRNKLSKPHYEKLKDKYGKKLDGYISDENKTVKYIGLSDDLQKRIGELEQALYLANMLLDYEKDLNKKLQATINDKETIIDMLKTQMNKSEVVKPETAKQTTLSKL